MSLLPIFVKLRDRLVVVVGGGSVAEGKIEGLLAAEARVRVVAPRVTLAVARWVAQGKVEWRAKSFAEADLNGAYLVIAATSAAGVNEAIFSEADARGILCNAVDDIEHCHFYYGAVVQRGDLQIAVSTNGKSPALAQRLRLQLEKQFGPEYELWLEWLGAARQLLRAGDGNTDAKKVLLHHIASQPMFERFLKEARRHRAGGGVMGKVYLVGAGPGDSELLTVKAARLLARAGIVFHDSLVSREVLQLIGREAEVIDVGKRCGQKLLTQDEINSLLVSAA
jgi:siroheme synthase-like protein